MIFYSLIAFFSTFFILKIFMQFFRKYFIAYPNKRSSHSNPTPSAGGLSFFIPVLILSILTKNFNAFICAPLAFIGAVDDKKSLSSKLRFTIQSLTIIGLIFINHDKFFGYFDLNDISYYLVIFFLFLLGVSIINFMNFMDGIDGLIALNTLIFFSFISIFLNSYYFIFSFSLLAFIIFNWHPAKIFMGDVGSNFLGSIYFIALFEAGNLLDFIFLLVIFSPILGDALISLLRRALKRENIFTPHKKHLYQRLVQAGWSHSKVTLIYAAATLVNSFFYFNFGYKSAILIVFCIIVFGIFLDKKFAIPFE